VLHAAEITAVGLSCLSGWYKEEVLSLNYVVLHENWLPLP